MPRPSPHAALLRARLAVGDPDALELVRDALRRHGTASGAAAELGVSAATAQRWAVLVGLGRRRGNPAWAQNVTRDG